MIILGTGFWVAVVLILSGTELTWLARQSKLSCTGRTVHDAQATNRCNQTPFYQAISRVGEDMQKSPTLTAPYLQRALYRVLTAPSSSTLGDWVGLDKEYI